MIFIEVEIVDGVKGFVCSVIVRLVGMIKFQHWRQPLSYVELVNCLFARVPVCFRVLLLFLRLYRPINTSLLLHFIFTIAILTVVLHIFIPLIRATGLQLFIPGEYSKLDQTRPTSLAGPFQSGSTRFNSIQYAFTLTWKSL